MNKYFNILRSCTLFDGITDDDLEKLLKCLGVKIERFDKKYTIFAEGKPARYIGVMLSGSAQVVQVDYYGNRSIDIPFDRQELADYLEVDRSGLSNEISKLRREGLIKNNRKHFELL